jgi:hypothetical protein
MKNASDLIYARKLALGSAESLRQAADEKLREFRELDSRLYQLLKRRGKSITYSGATYHLDAVDQVVELPCDDGYSVALDESEPEPEGHSLKPDVPADIAAEVAAVIDDEAA